MTKQEAIEFVNSCDESDGPETVEEAHEIFEAIFGTKPESGMSQLDAWSHACAAAECETESEAEKLVSQCEFDSLNADEIDALEPWTWANAETTEDDNGEDFTAVFSDGSKARWINSDRAWTVIE